MSVSVIIPTFGRQKLAMSLAKALRRRYRDIEIILVEQEALKPPSRHELEKYEIRYFNLLRANTSAAKNKGLQEARGEIVLFLDDDVELTARCIENHLKEYEEPGVVGVAGRVLNDGETVPENTDVETGKTNFLGTFFSFDFWSTRRQKVSFAYGCNMSFRRSVLFKVGGFDERFNKIFEEIDLGLRVSKYGNIVFSPQALVYHHRAKEGGTRTNKENKMKMIYGAYGYYIGKNIFFPFSLITLFLRLRSALKEAPYAVVLLFKTYLLGLRTERGLMNVLAVFAFGVIIFLRFYKVGEFFSFNYDEEYQATLAWSLVKDFHVLWIGVSTSGLKYYLGPGFTYLNWLLFKISQGDPLILAYFAAGWGIVTTASVGYVTKKLMGTKAALIASLLYGGSAFFVLFDRRFWNPLLVPFLAVWLIYSLIKAKENVRYLTLTSVLIAVSYHIHLSLWVFWPIIIYTLYEVRSKLRLPLLASLVVLFLLITSPLLVFDFVHNFDNVLAPLRYLQEASQSPSDSRAYDLSTIFSHVSTLWQGAGRIFFLRPFTNIQEEHNLGAHGELTQPPSFLPLFTLLTLIYFMVRTYKDKRFFLVSFIILSYIIFFIFYPGVAGEYFLLAPLTLMVIPLAWFLARFSSISNVLFLSVFLAINGLTIVTLTQEKYGLLTRKKLIQQVMTYVKKEPFALETYGRDTRNYPPYGGWRYLFKIYGRTPAAGFADEYFAWIYPDEITDIRPTYNVMIYEETDERPKGRIVGTIQEGAFTAYILKR